MDKDGGIQGSEWYVDIDEAMRIWRAHNQNIIRYSVGCGFCGVIFRDMGEFEAHAWMCCLEETFGAMMMENNRLTDCLKV